MGMVAEYDPELDLDAHLLGGVDVFERAARKRYASPEDAKAIAGLARQIVELLRQTLEDLSDAKYAEMWRDLQIGLERVGLAEDVNFALQADLARQVIDTDGMTARCMELLAVVAHAAPPENVLRFLRRVSRCYILGLAPECIVMCRAGFENALNARYQMERIPYPSDSKGRQTMRARVEGAIKRGWLEKEAGRRALQLAWGRGSKAAHEDPEAVGAPLEAIQATMRAVELLHAPPFDPVA